MRTIVATGAHSGLGYEALKHFFSLQSSSATRLYIGCRQPEIASKQIESDASSQHQFQTLPLDLRSHTSVTRFADSVSSSLKASKIDVLLLCAGSLKASRDPSTKGQYGEDFVVNHLSQYYLYQLLQPHLAPQARLVFVASGLHERLKDNSKLDAILKGETEPYNGMQSYSASKFAQMLAAQKLHRISQSKGTRVIAVSPGFVPSTGLSRELSALKRFGMSYVMPWLPFATTPVDGGKAIYRAMVEELPQPVEDGDVLYMNPKDEVIKPHPATRSEQLQDRYCPDDKAALLKLWKESICAEP